jgi:hypothetical protein
MNCRLKLARKSVFKKGASESQVKTFNSAAAENIPYNPRTPCVEAFPIDRASFLSYNFFTLAPNLYFFCLSAVRRQPEIHVEF